MSNSNFKWPNFREAYNRNFKKFYNSGANPDKAIPFVIAALNESIVDLRRNAVFIFLEQKPKEAILLLKTVLNDEDFETRFYAVQAIKLIEREN